jgi:hypothetical protein
MWKFLAGAGVVVIAVIAACSASDLDPSGACEYDGPPGVLVAAPGIDLQVKDQYGQGEAIGTTVDVTGPTGSLQSNITDTLHIFTAYGVSGDFTVTLHRQYYQDLTISKISVVPAGCLVATTHVPVTLQLAAGAPPLRALSVEGREYLGAPRAQAQLVAHFDADPSVSRQVTWTVSDTSLATIDANGVITAKCPNAGGTVTATATTVATPKLSADATMGVAPAQSCP